MAEGVGFEPTWAMNPNGFQDRLVMTASISLRRRGFGDGVIISLKMSTVKYNGNKYYRHFFDADTGLPGFNRQISSAVINFFFSFFYIYGQNH